MFIKKHGKSLEVFEGSNDKRFFFFCLHPIRLLFLILLILIQIKHINMPDFPRLNVNYVDYEHDLYPLV